MRNTLQDRGWTALMVAAAYGTAEAVDVLIRAGSDVNAADKNCGGQTVFMWAARSGTQSKKKLRNRCFEQAQICTGPPPTVTMP